jgi:hypothetical protein
LFKLADSVPQDCYPKTTVTGQTVGPVVYTTMKVSNAVALVAFNRVEFSECVRTGLPLLDDAQREELIVMAGGYTADQQQAALDRAVEVETELESARADLDVLAMEIAQKVVDNVIDLDAERAKRRPEPATAA